MNAKQIKESTFFLVKKEYEDFLEWRSSAGFKIAKQCGIDNTDESIWFIQKLLLRAFPYVVSNEEAAKDLIKFAEKAAKNGDDFISTLIIAQIDQAENPVKMAKDWAEAQLKGSDSR